jgi:hypothetical protein
VLDLFRFGIDYRQGFPLIADLVESLYQEEALGKTLPSLPVGELLASLNLVGARQAAKVLRAAELPEDVLFEDLGSGDVDRLSRKLHIFAAGIPRDL